MQLTICLLLSLTSLSASAVLPRPAKMALAQLRGMHHEALQLLESITDEEQMDLVEAILDRDEEDEEAHAVNRSPLMVMTTDLDDTSRSVLGRLRELRDEEKKILKDLRGTIDVKEISVKLLKEEIWKLEEQERQWKKQNKGNAVDSRR